MFYLSTQQSGRGQVSSINTNYRRSLVLLCSLLALLSNIHPSWAESGLINRTPLSQADAENRTKLITAGDEQSEIEQLKNSIGDVMKSINQIIDTPMDTTSTIVIPEITTVPVEPVPEIIAEPQVKDVKPDTTAIESLSAKPATDAPVIVEAEKPETRPVLAEKDLKDSSTEPELHITYLKHDIHGNEVADNNSEWACVEDIRNGLVWEVKASNGGIRDRNHSYTWFDPSVPKLHGIADGGRCDGVISCDTHAYIEAINEQKLCGYSDWRLPTRDEMMSLVDFEQEEPEAKIDTDYFPQALASWYWTASSNESHPQYAWYVLFRNGISLNDLKQRPKHVRLVRGNKRLST